MSLPTTPTVADYLAFIRSTGITMVALPDNSGWIQWTYDIALATVNPYFACVVPELYVLAVYNLGVDTLYNYAQDTAPSTFFADARKAYNLYGFVAGVVNTASDQGTSDGLVVPDFMTQLTLSDLQNLKTPWGRNYLAIAQKWGPDLFGIT